MVAYPFTRRNGCHQQLCVISLSYIFYIFQHRNLLEKGLFCRRFRRSEGPLQKNCLRIKVFEISFSTPSNIPKSCAKQQQGPGVSPDEPVLTIRPCSRPPLAHTYLLISRLSGFTYCHFPSLLFIPTRIAHPHPPPHTTCNFCNHCFHMGAWTHGYPWQCKS